ncbi:unnamed protein product [Rotaria magnacalcarata]|uniref:Uncharacterized protein n=2 Tax=Rotaria magnacalcarata TaxID=392030 RepID=A0A816NEC4_9BILA|nr:unnamed protein product [Rotaria magnacalcarata]
MYMNGIDVFKIFDGQLNQRFTTIITQCQRFRFDFTSCRKDDFYLCMNVFPAYIDRIEELTLSEENAPDQLYLYVNYQLVDWRILENALSSLSDTTTVNTLSIKTMNIMNDPSLKQIFLKLFQLKSLKRFSLMSTIDLMNSHSYIYTTSNIEHLNIFVTYFDFDDLQHIMQCESHLKYLNIQIISKRSLSIFPRRINRSKNNIVIMSALRTLLLSFKEDCSVSIDMLAEYLKCMPALNRLEIKAYNKLMNADAWQMLFETSLPLLTHFSLQTTRTRLNENNPGNVLISFQSPYWIAKENFNIMITEHTRDDVRYYNQWEFDQPIVQCWMAPYHIINNDLITINVLYGFLIISIM